MQTELSGSRHVQVINGGDTGPDRPLRVLFYEPAHSGHHVAYLGRMLPGFFDLPAHLGLATTAAAVSSVEYRKSILPLEDRLEVLPVCRPRPRSQLRTAWQRYRETAQLAKSWHADHLCILYADGIWQIATTAALFGVKLFPQNVPVEGWIYRGAFSYPDAHTKSAAAKRFLFRKLLQLGVFTKLHFDDDLLMHHAEQIPRRKTEIALAPGPILLCQPRSMAQAREQLGLPLNAKLISTSGMISRWKGCGLALDAFAKMLDGASTGLQNVRLVLAGPHEAEILAKLHESPFQELFASGRILSIDRFLNEDEMLMVAEASDLVLVTYLNHSGRSSIAHWAAAAGKPVLGTNWGCIDYVIRRERLGRTCDVHDARAFGQSIRDCLHMSWTKDDARRVRHFAAWHSVENYQRLASKYVRERCHVGAHVASA